MGTSHANVPLMHIDAPVRSVVCRRPGTAVLADRHLHPPPTCWRPSGLPMRSCRGCMVRIHAWPPRRAGPAAYLFSPPLHRRAPVQNHPADLRHLAGIGVGYLLMHRLAPADKLLRRPPPSCSCCETPWLPPCRRRGRRHHQSHPVSGPLLYGLGFWFASELVNCMTILPGALTPSLTTACPPRTLLYRTEFSWARLMPLLSLVASPAAHPAVEGPGSIAFPVPALLWCAVTYLSSPPAC